MSVSLKLCLHGASGRMGIELRALLSANSEFSYSSIKRPNFEGLEGADVCIDFSHASTVSALAQACSHHRVNLLVGTSGLSAADDAALKAASSQIAVLKAANTSLGVLALEIASQAAAKILGSGFDIEVLELHHNGKRDAPSGTAAALVKALGSVEQLKYGRSGERQPGEVGVASMRGGDVVGEHTVFFLGQGERLELTHRAHSRSLYAAGALRLARLLLGRKPGLYTSREVLLGPGT